MEQNLISHQVSEILLSHTQTVLWRREAYYLLKRLLDVIFSAVGLILSLPFYLPLMLLIRLDSPGSALFVQTRVGSRRHVKDGLEVWEPVLFEMYKFRTMVQNADPAVHCAYVQALITSDEGSMKSIQGGDNHIKKLVHDARITRVGRILRKTSIDELPQLWNVLKGDMSLVGPRPALQYEVEKYQPWHMKRLRAKPGITGLQQVKARCTESFDKQVHLDIQYTEHLSILSDLKIILLTPLTVFVGRGAR